MGISPISDYSSFYANYRMPQIPSADVDGIQKQNAAALQEKPITPEQDIVNDIDLAIEEKPQIKTNTDVHDLSLSFNLGEDYSYIGKDSDIGDLDMQKAISDMKKDQILQQYQYFVGSAQDMFSEDAGKDGLVFMKF